MEQIINLLYFLHRACATLVLKSSFRYFGKGAKVGMPRRIKNAKNIHIGESVSIQKDCWLFCCDEKLNSEIYISEHSSIGFGCALISMKRVSIGKSVLIADNVHITDNSFEIADLQRPIKDQGLKLIKEVSIGDNSWIGTNVVIIGAHIGKHCVVGANSFVNKDFPDYSVIAGAPAKLIGRVDD